MKFPSLADKNEFYDVLNYRQVHLERKNRSEPFTDTFLTLCEKQYYFPCNIDAHSVNFSATKWTKRLRLSARRLLDSNMTFSATFSPTRATVKRQLALNHMDYDNLTGSLHPCVTSLRQNVLHFTSKNIEFLQKKKTNPKQTKGNNANNLIETNV